MLANFFAKSKPINFIVLLFLFLGTFIFTIVNLFSIEHFTTNFLLEKALIFGLFLIVFFFINFIVSKNNLTYDNSYAFLFYLLIINTFLEYFINIEVLIFNVLNLFFLRKLYSLQSLKGVFKKLFDAGFWLGIMFLIHPFSLVFFFLIYISLIVYKKVRFQTILIPFIGFLVPVFFFFTYCFWFDKTEDFFGLFLFFSTYDYSLYLENSFLIPFLIFGLFFLISIILKTPKALSVNNTFKKSWIVLLFHFLTTLSFLIFNPTRNGSELLLLAFPSAIIIANGFELIAKKILKESLIVLFVLVSFLVLILL